VAAVVFDTGALIAIDRGDRRVGALLHVAARDQVDVVTSCACVSEAWRDPGRQARLARALAGVIERSLDPAAARASGVLLGRARASDIADAAVALLAGSSDTIVTSDPSHITVLVDVLRTGARVLPI
jgi:hypothetical protein